MKTTVDNTTTPSKTTTTLYLGGIVYQNDTLQFIGHEEGRARWALHHYVNGSTAYGFEYDYFLKDHLGNTRMVLTQEKDTAQYIATMEAAYRTTENQLFYNIPQTSYPRASVAGYPTDNTTVPNDSLARVNGNGPKTGPAILLKVMSGDVVDIATKSFYKSGGTVNSPNSTLTDIVNSLAGGLVTATSGSHGVITDFTNTSSPMYAAVNAFLPSNDPNTTGKPKAYLNWILLDDQFKGVSTYPQSGAIVVGSADVLNTLAYSGIPITKNGYLYIWVSNETPGWDVFFDNLSLKQYSGPITEETHYYPFGLTMAGISDKAISKIENKFKYNGKELQHNEFSDGTGLEEYDYGARMQDPQLGRFNILEPYSSQYFEQSLYGYANNNGISNIDVEGLFKFSKENEAYIKKHYPRFYNFITSRDGILAVTSNQKLLNTFKILGFTEDEVKTDYTPNSGAEIKLLATDESDFKFGETEDDVFGQGKIIYINKKILDMLEHIAKTPTEIKAALFTVTDILTHEEGHRVGLLKYGDGNHHTGSEDGEWAVWQIWGNLKAFGEHESHSASEQDLEQKLLEAGIQIVRDPSYPGSHTTNDNSGSDNSNPFKHLWGVY